MKLSLTAVAAYLALIVVSAAFSSGFVVAAPAVRTPGVKPGDWVRYGNFLSHWNAERPGQSPFENLLDANATLWVQSTVLSVSGALVTFESRTHYRNGTETSLTSEVDVNTGVGDGNLTYVSVGLGVGDRVYTIGDLGLARINATLSRSYVGLTRQTNLLNVTSVSNDVVNGTSTALWSEHYWDKTTGVIVEQFWSFANIDASGFLTEASIEYEMIDNSMWLDPNISDNVPPVASAGVDQIVDFGTAVVFDASGSTDNIGIAEFDWSFGDGAQGSGMQVSHIYAKAGVFNVTLTVEDSKGNVGSDFVMITVKEAPSLLPPWLSGSVIGIVFAVAVLFAAVLFLRRRR
jgi:hypothetical protein